MKKQLSFIILLSILSLSTTTQARSVEASDPAFVILDILLYRPVGLIATIAGAGAFVAISPFTALASIPAPHDAFIKTSKILILAPGAYTFVRPIGNREFPYMPSQRQRLVTPVNHETVKPTQPPSKSVAPIVTK